MTTLRFAGLIALGATGCKPPTTALVHPSEETGRVKECPPSVIAAPPPLPGSPDDREAPRVVTSTFNGVDRVLLQFSEPLDPPAKVNPRQFRISKAYSTVDYAGAYSSASYYDLALQYGDETPLVFLAIEQPEPDQLLLVLNRGIPDGVCENIRLAAEDAAAAAASPDAGAIKTHSGLFLHYTNRGSVGVRDVSHNKLDDFGGEWALHFGARQRSISGAHPLVRFDLLVELQCPPPGEFVGPPGPS